LKGGESTLAISKQHKAELVAQYTDWMQRSQALFLTEYKGMKMSQIDELRKRVREAGGEFHIVKNTLSQVALKKAGLELPPKLLEGSSAVIFAFQDAPSMAKVLADFSRTSDFVKAKGGYLDKRLISTKDVQALAELPPLPVMRAQLLGVIMGPASKLARTLAEPARQVATVLKAYADTESTPTAA
jgi:large subunit ribosomal protein L10